jgi:PPOX class probable F420-dependent enzyme
VDLPEGLVALLRTVGVCFLATTMPDGSPHLTQVWADTDGEHILVNTVPGFRKVRNIERDPRVAFTIADRASTQRYYAVRGRVVSTTTEGAREHVEALSQRYLGGPYPWFSGRDQPRMILRIEADRINAPW